MDINKFLEFLNLYLVLIDFLAMGVLAVFIIKRNDFTNRSSKLAIGLMTYTFGHALIRGWTLFWRIIQAKGISLPSWIDPSNISLASVPIFPIGLVITTAGLVCVVRILLSSFSNAWAWTAVTGCVFISLGVVYFLI